MAVLRFLCLYVIPGIYLSVFNFSYADIIYPSKIVKGRVYSFPLNLNSSYQITAGSWYEIKDAALFVIDTKYNLNGMNTNCLSSSLFSWTSDNRYYGLTVAKDTVIAIVDATSNSSAELGNLANTPVSYDTYTGGGSWNSQGVFTPTFTLSSGQSWCSGKPYNSTRYNARTDSVLNGTLTGTLVLYAGPNAGFSSVNIPPLYWNLTLRGEWIANAQSIEIIEPIECTVSAPPAVNFGRVNLNGIPNDGLLATAVQGIDISCTANAASTVAEQMNISFNGAYQNGYWGRLLIKNSSGVPMGYIRGRYLDAEGLCAGDSQNEVGFNGTSAIKKINNVGVGTTHIPITWSLCSNNSGLLGEGSAQATVNINWD